jgi:hypothetical protein
VCDLGSAPSDDSCVVNEELGVFVAPGGSDDTRDGSRTAPFATIQAAIDNSGGKRVYVCAGEAPYDETLRIADAVEIYGGFDCETWLYDAANVVQIESPDTIAVTVTSVDGAVFHDLAIGASDATDLGGSSIAMLVGDSTGVVLNRVSLTAGAGAKGADGRHQDEQRAPQGTAGNPGADACTNSGSGGEWAWSSCGGTQSENGGGEGGDGGTSTSDGEAGQAGLPREPATSDGLPGAGETLANDCRDGTRGASGASGNAGAAGPPVGTLSVDGYDPSDAQRGLDGQLGQGGGGGGGARAPSSCGGGTPTGAGGGSGGGGGCPGRGGGGGQSGGASIALASVNSGIVMEAVTLVAVEGGRGGNAGRGQRGGAGGVGADGGAEGDDGLPGCDGRDGGAGGSGGPGGAGSGGPSVGIAYVGQAPVEVGPAEVTVAAVPAAPGEAATNGNAGAEGLDELRASF